jgi:hypothetical protein
MQPTRNFLGAGMKSKNKRSKFNSISIPIVSILVGAGIGLIFVFIWEMSFFPILSGGFLVIITGAVLGWFGGFLGVTMVDRLIKRIKKEDFEVSAGLSGAFFVSLLGLVGTTMSSVIAGIILGAFMGVLITLTVVLLMRFVEYMRD